jgi:hypothetical protein
MKHPTMYKNYHDKTILASIITIIQIRIHPLSIYKVCAHANIKGNKQADELAIANNELPYRPRVYSQFKESTKV